MVSFFKAHEGLRATDIGVEKAEEWELKVRSSWFQL